MFDLIIRGGTCVTPTGRSQVDIGIRDERIAAIGDLGSSTANAEFDARHLHVLPGVIDSHVHFREPGLTQKEDLHTGSAAAAIGGVTAYFEMPNTSPPTTDAASLADKVARARASSYVDFAFYVGAASTNIDKLAELERAEGCCGIKVFLGSSTGNLLVADREQKEQVLRAGVRRLSCHCEDEERLRERREILAVPGAPVGLHPEWRDEECAVRSTREILELAAKTKRPVHILHVTSAGEIPLLAEHRAQATFEVTPQHLTLSAPECYERLGTLAQMNPPIRTEAHRVALWKALASGLVDVVGSDHAPHTREEKARPWPTSPSGMPGVQTLVPVMLEHVHAGRLTLERFVELTSAGVARVYGLRDKGRIAVGAHADFTVVDLAAHRRIEDSWIRSRCGWTPFAGFLAHGWPVGTIVRGSVVMKDGELIGLPRGKPVAFSQAVAED